MALDPRTIVVASTVAELRAQPGQYVTHYAMVIATGLVYRWALASPLEDDGRTVLVPTTGGYAGAWLAIRQPAQGADLTDSSPTLTVGGGRLRRLPAGTLSAHRTATLSTDNAAEGDEIEITRLDVGAYTYAIANGGGAGGTLVTLPISARSNAVAYFDGTDWLLRRSCLMI